MKIYPLLVNELQAGSFGFSYPDHGIYTIGIYTLCHKQEKTTKFIIYIFSLDPISMNGV